jgi:hypothetical protein
MAMHPKFEEARKKEADLRMVAAFVRLRGICDASVADILKDPIPYLEKAQKEIVTLRGALDIAIRELDGSLEMVRSAAAPPRFEPMDAILMRRNRNALKVLRDAIEIRERSTPPQEEKL